MKIFTIVFIIIIIAAGLLKSADLRDTSRFQKRSADSSVIQDTSGYKLSNYPNPFNPSTLITFRLDIESKVSLKVYNVLGQLITVMIDSKLPPGEHKFNFNAAEIPGGVMSGVYFYRLEAWGDNGSRYSEIRKMILTK